MTTPHWHILGAGAIGQLWASALAQAGCAVTLILRSGERQAALTAANHCLTRTNPDGSQHTFKVRSVLVNECDQISNLLCTTKSYDTLTALSQIKHALSDISNVLVIQNGLQGQEDAKRLLNNIPLWVGSSTDGAWRADDFSITHAGIGETRIGAYNKQATHVLPKALPANLSLAVLGEENITLILWRKLAINCAINPLTVLFNCKNGELLAPQPHALMAEVCQEIEQLTHALNITLFKQSVLSQAEQIAKSTAQNHSSMLQDYRNQRPTELAAMTGFLLAQADTLGVDLPVNRKVYLDVKRLTQYNV
ncbi:MAG: ketopantoate reductase family protein [Pontibacterium sp.]